VNSHSQSGTKNAAQQHTRDSLAEAAHSAAMAGLVVSAETLADSDAYAAGMIDLHEFGRRVRARHGLV
jgi:hypothetical protein